jgi:PAS domain S-box-containing protein
VESHTLSNQEASALAEILWHKSMVGIALLTEGGRFQWANPEFCNIVEYTETELQSRTFQSITHPDDVEADTEQAQQVREGERSTYLMRKRYITKSGKIVWIVLAVHPLTVGSDFRYFVSQIKELTHLSEAPIIPPKRKITDWTKIIRENYQWMIIVLGSLGIIIAKVLET